MKQNKITQSKTVKISCSHLWKIFGINADNFLKEFPNPSAEDFKNAGHIGAVKDVSCDVYEGEILMIMGLSGSGKSTLIRCITRLSDPTHGAVLFDGKNLATASEKELIALRRHKMGMVFQDFGLLPHRTVIENVAFPLEIQGVDKVARLKRAKEVVELVGLDGREHYFPRELSGGQQQRVGIARSLAIEPDVWFLDEPFSALDPLIRRDMQDEFIRLQKMLQKTILFITHDFDEAIRLGDRIGIMKDGAIVQLDTPENIILYPSSSYVEEFTKDAPIGNILSVQSLMKPLTSSCDLNKEKSVTAVAKIDSVLAEILHAEMPILVVDHEKNPVGMIEKSDVITALFDRS